MWDTNRPGIIIMYHLTMDLFSDMFTCTTHKPGNILSPVHTTGTGSSQLDLQWHRRGAVESWGGETLASIGKKLRKTPPTHRGERCHVQAITALEELVPRMALTATSEDSARAQINYVEQGITECRKKAHELDREIDKVKSDIEEGFRMEEGPFIIGLDRALKGFNVQHEAYYGGTFVGNHVHRCLKAENINTLCQSVVTVAEECPPLLESATAVCRQFVDTFTLFAACHNKYSNKYLSEATISTLETDIKTFLQHYRQTYPHATVTPKLHLLEDHMAPLDQEVGWSWIRGNGRARGREHPFRIQ
ncbi:hypothetical protein GBAR_LOCUS1082 [Geodia barretti]|uniref:Uncharacterized protein n=1 Tax=Geodia barretti TaxID=519541 RepID=A0AA35QUN3_GEOBA|nr:hypothetical protein GBAR_LOCUS1082 [Geodia barretti]